MAKWDIHIHLKNGTTVTKRAIEVEGTTASMADAPFVNWWPAKKYKRPSKYILSVPHRK